MVTATASFTGDATHAASNNEAMFAILKADANIVVNGYSGTYDGAEPGATGSAAGDPE